MRDVGQITIKQGSASGVFFEQGQHVRHEPVVVSTGGLQERPLLRLGKIGRLVKEGLDSLPARAVHCCSPLTLRL